MLKAFLVCKLKSILLDIKLREYGLFGPAEYCLSHIILHRSNNRVVVMKTLFDFFSLKLSIPLHFSAEGKS